MRYFRYLRWFWRSFPLFRAFGVPVEVHSTYLVFPLGLFAYLAWMDDGFSGLLMLFGVIATVVPSILVHEFAHILTAARFGIPTGRVLIVPVGCVAFLEEIPSETAEIVIAIAGPAASGLLSLLGWVATALSGAEEGVDTIGIQFWFRHLCQFNLIVGLFNLLPCFPMDGGRVLRGVLTILIGCVWRQRAATALLIATRIAVRCLAWPIAVGMIVLTIGFTHLWHHLLIFVLVPLLGEAELYILKVSPQFGRTAIQLSFLPVASARQPRRQTGLRLSPWSDLMTIEATRAS